MLFVPWAQPPTAQHSSSTYQPQPAGPGLPSAEPSAAAMIVTDRILPSRQARSCRELLSAHSRHSWRRSGSAWTSLRAFGTAYTLPTVEDQGATWQPAPG